MQQRRSRRTARPDRRGERRTLDSHGAGVVLQHRRQEDTLGSAQRLRPGDDRLLSLARHIHAGGAEEPHHRASEDGVRRHSRPRSSGAWQQRTHLPTEDCGLGAHIHHRKGTGDTPRAERYASLQQRIRRRQGGRKGRRAADIPTHGCRLGTRRGTLPDWCRSNGRQGL